MKLRTFAAGAALCCLLCGGSFSLAACGRAEDPSVLSEPAEETTSSAEQAITTNGLSIGGVFTDNARSYQITLPEDWIEDVEQTDNNTVLFLSPDGNRSVEIRRQKADPNLLGYTEAEFKKAYAASFDSFKLLEYKRFKNDEYACVRLRFTCKENGKKYTVTQYVIPGKYDYNITWSALNHDEDFYKMTVNSVLTFRELNPTYPTVSLAGRTYGRTYTDAELRYTITLPKSWKVKSRSGDQALFISSDKKSNINVQCTEIDKDLYQYQKSYFTTYFQKTFGKTAKITAFTSKKVNGISARYLECAYTYSGQNLTSCQYLINKGDYTYSITFTAPTAGMDRTAFNAAVKTFTVTAK